MKTMTMLLITAALAAVSVAPQAMAQSCGAARTSFKKRFQTQPNGPKTDRLSSTPMSRADDLRADYTEGAGDLALKTSLHQLSAELSLGTSSRYLAFRSSKAPGGVILPQFNWWCFVQCLRNGGSTEDCSILCSGRPVQQ